MTNKLAIMRDEYPGDDAWKRFVDFFRSAWLARADRDSLSSTIGDEEFAIVLSVSMGERAVAWFQTPVPAFDGRSASDILRHEPSGQKIIRTVLMRMPR
jgi:hypothetical protein